MAQKPIAATKKSKPSASAQAPADADTFQDNRPLPASVGPYRVLAALGEGAVGRVFLAEQDEPVARQVAVKVIKAGMDSRRVLRLFRGEQQTLAGMNHAYIAQVYDAGTTENGFPYFAMEYIPGRRLTAYCDSAQMSVEKRLDLFVKICEAVAYSHQRGVIHRDLKPANILVYDHEGVATPKVIDFGIAKAVDNPSDGTAIDAPLGTLAYMSPEQAAGRLGDTDTRSDVYALGCILFELLAGSSPHRDGTGITQTFDEDGERIGTRFKALPAETRVAIAAQRATETEKLTRILSGDLAWITAKALQHERDQRYQSAALLMQDIAAYRAGKPVSARRPHWRYHLSRALRRNKWLLLAAAMVVGGLLAGTVLALRGIEQAEAAQQRALVAAQRATKSQQHLAEFLESADPSHHGNQIPLRVMLSNYSDSLSPDHEPDPLIRAFLHTTVAQSFLQLGDLTRARHHIEEALDLRRRHLPEDDPEILVAGSVFGEILRQSGELTRADILQRQSRNKLSAQLGPSHEETLAATARLARVRRDQGRDDEALALYDEVYRREKARLGATHPKTLDALQAPAEIHTSQNRLALAEGLWRDVVTGRRTHLGVTHAATLRAQRALAEVLAARGRAPEALTLLEETLGAMRTHLGASHPQTLTCTASLAAHNAENGRHREALTHYRELLPLIHQEHGADHPLELAALHGLGISLLSDNQPYKALPWLEQAATRAQAILGAQHRDTLRYQQGLISGYRQTQQWAMLAERATAVLPLLQQVYGHHHAETKRIAGDLAVAFDELQREREAIDLRLQYNLK